MFIKMFTKNLIIVKLFKRLVMKKGLTFFYTKRREGNYISIV
jgi:hypothetical protein